MSSWMRLTITTLVWIAVAGGLWATFERQVAGGTEIALKAVPIDPRDLLRGDYVILRYEISNPDVAVGPAFSRKNRTVYVSIADVGEPHGWLATDVSLSRPSDGLFLRGRVRRWRDSRAEIVYGIESFFVPEGEGLRYEEARNRDQLWAVVAVSPHGVARLKRLEIR